MTIRGATIFLDRHSRLEYEMAQDVGRSIDRSCIRRWSRLKKRWYPAWCVTSWLVGFMSFLPLFFGEKVLFVILLGLMALFQLWWRRQGKKVFWRCPRCGHDLGLANNKQSFLSTEIEYNEAIENLKVCPNCGANLAE